MVHYYIYANDYSGSTEGVKYFHRNGMKSFRQFKSDVEKIEKELLVAGEPPTKSKIIYLLWGTSCFEVDEKTTVETYTKMKSGNMGTEPESIIEWIQKNCENSSENKIKLLYIITDGMTSYGSAEKCFKLNENMKYETVVFHAFNNRLDCIDLSVASSFFKNNCLVYRNYDLFDSVNISEEFDYDKISVDNFETEKEHMRSYIKLKFIMNSKHDILALNEIDKLKKLRRRLFEELAAKAQQNQIDLNTKDKEVFLRDFANTTWYRSLTAPEQDLKIGIEKAVTTLINYIVSDQKSYSFDALKFDKNFDKPVEEEPMEVDINFTTEQEIEFPDIILDDEKGIPVIILTEFNLLDKIIFHKKEESDNASPASFSKFKSMMECPLFLLNDSDVSESIGYFYTLNVYKQLLEHGRKTEPRTRRPFHGGLVLTDTDTFDKYNDYILSATYFDFKKVNYNIALFYYVLWKNCENKEWMDKNVVERLKEYVMRRISGTVCRIGLSSLPLDPPMNTSLLTALWYCVELSSCVFKDDPKCFAHERLRMYYGVAHCMIEILNNFNYNLDLESIEKRRDLIRHVMILKKIPTRREKVCYVLEKVFKNINGFLVSEVEKPFNFKKLNYLNVDHKGMLDNVAIEKKVNLNDYIHLLHFVGEASFEICEITYRPFFVVDEKKSFYTELVQATKKVVINIDDDSKKTNITYDAVDTLEFDKIVSPYNLFIKCVKDYKRYPTLPEFMEYVLKKKKYNGDLVTVFPSNIYSYVETAYLRYQNIAAKVDVTEFIDVCKKYVKRSNRIKAEEGVMTFKNFYKINDFIAKEEKKVGLKKNTQVNKNK